MLVGGGQHLAVAGLDGGKVAGKPFVVVRVSPPGDGRKYVIYGEKQALFGKIGEQADHVISPAVDFDMLPFGNVINPDVGFGAAWHGAGRLFADKEIRVAAQLFGSADGIVIGQRDQVHAAFAQRGVNVSRSAVAFQKKMAQDSDRQGT